MAANKLTEESKSETHKIFSIEFQLYQKFNSECNGADMMMKAIYDSLTEGDVPKSLFDMYSESAYGSDKNVKRKMRNRMYYIGKKLR